MGNLIETSAGNTGLEGHAPVAMVGSGSTWTRIWPTKYTASWANKQGRRLSMSRQNASNVRRRGETAKTAKTHRTPERAASHPPIGAAWAAPTSVRVAAVLVAGIVLGVLLSSGLQNIVAQQPAGAQRWEYGRFGFAMAGVVWSTPDHHFVAEDPADLHRYIAKTEPQGNVSPVEIVNLIGSRGWELVSVTYSRDPRDYDDYWFKRSDNR